MENQRLDVRAIPPPQRHPKIFATFDTLEVGQSLILISDHEPRPLRAEFDHKRQGAYQWEQRQFGDGRWEVVITPVDRAASASPVAGVLARCATFHDLDAGTLDTLAYHTRRIHVKRSHVVVDQGVNWPYVGVVEHGVVQAMLATSAGREQTMYEVLPPDLFGELPLLDGGSTALRFVAVTTDTIVLLLSIGAVRSVLERFPPTVRALGSASAQHSRAILDQFSAHLSQSTTARVARALLPYAAPDEGLAQVLEPLPKLTQSEIAMRAGTVKEVASRAIAELESAGALERLGGHIVRLDRAKLEESARED